MEMDEGDDDKQDLLDRLNKAVRYMSFPQYDTVYQQMYNVAFPQYGVLRSLLKYKNTSLLFNFSSKFLH